MTTTLASIKNQDASTFVCPWFLCPHCGIVDRDMDRMRVGHICVNCSRPSESGRLYYPVTIHILVDLVQQAYHSNAPVGPIDGPQTNCVGTLVFFCALREALLAHFLTEHMSAQELPTGVVNRLFDDNKLANQRFGKLFKSVVTVAWEDAVQDISTPNCDYVFVSELMQRASKVRNEFMHNGSAWGASDELATECVNSLTMVAQLFVMLHNRYIVPMWHGT